MNDKLQWSGRGAARHGGARSPDLVLVTLRMMERKPSFENYCLGFLQASMVWLTVLCGGAGNRKQNLTLKNSIAWETRAETRHHSSDS